LKIVALAGGVGGAKFAHGLARVLSPEDLTVVANTGDDFEHLGLYISPDLDTVCYTLAGLANPETGWGRAGESWNALAAIQELGGPAWFNLGDRDLATHIERTRRLREGQCLSEITRDFCRAWGVEHGILPMSDEPVRTIVETDEGDLPFQEYFVHRLCEPRVKAFRFDGVPSARPAPGVREALEAADAVIICPSNPWVSVDPILAVLPPLEKPVVAISPIIGGKTVRGPAAKMFAEMGIEPSAAAVAEHYAPILSAFVLDSSDQDLQPRVAVPTLASNILINSIADRIRLAQEVLHFIGKFT
jgi:LPPG:FO 2-phospho-L-lactate transferase